MNAQQIKKQISITDYLRKQGIVPVYTKGEDYWYFSPFRKESTPSFKVNINLNCWYDYGIPDGGNIISLIMKMNDFNTVSEVINYVETDNEFSRKLSFSFQQQKNSGLKIIKVKSLENSAIIKYLHERGINICVAEYYCNDIYFIGGGKNFFALGFKNNSGGYELRNPYFKGCTSKDVTTISNNSKSCLVFEGFMDFLSYLTLKNVTEPKENILILNSLINISKAKIFLQKHEKIFSYMDNDTGGKTALEIFLSMGLNVIDKSCLYKNFKDLNDYLMHQKGIKLETKKLKNRRRM